MTNRVRNPGAEYAPLERFLSSLKVPLLARLRDSQVYVDAAASGVGIFETDEAASAKERQEFMRIVEWVRGSGPRATTVIPLPGAHADLRHR